jgi:hypothetical protein
MEVTAPEPARLTSLLAGKRQEMQRRRTKNFKRKENLCETIATKCRIVCQVPPCEDDGRLQGLHEEKGSGVIR